MTPEQKKAKVAAAEAEYQAMRQQLAAQGELSELETDSLIREALSAFGICNTNVQGCVLGRTSAATKIRALKALLS